MQHKSRRAFIKTSFWSVPLLNLKRFRSSAGIAAQPLVLSTWDSGPIPNEAAWKILNAGGKAIDAVEQGGIAIEDVISCCVGLGGNPDRDGHVTLDACIMDEKANCGGVAFLERIKHPVSVARKVMENTPHVLLVGQGAQQFALSEGFPLESGELSESAEKAYKNWLITSEYKPQKNIELNQKENIKPPGKMEDGSFNHDTMGTIALDQNGDLSGMCTTSGLGFKMRGRVGDSPIIGSGLFVDNEVGAAVATGQGEEIIRVAGSHLVVEFMRDGLTPQEACQKTVERIVRRDKTKAKDFQACFIAINKKGEMGAFAIHPGFNFTVTHETSNHVVTDSMSYF